MLTRILAILLVAVSLLAYQYHAKLATVRESLTTTQQQLDQEKWNREALESLNASNAAIDKQHQEDLTSAKAEIDRLRADVERGAKQLHVAATCPTVPAGKGTSASGLGYAAAPTLTADAERNYWRLRRGVVICENQVGYLQDYIRHILDSHNGALNAGK